MRVYGGVEGAASFSYQISKPERTLQPLKIVCLKHLPLKIIIFVKHLPASENCIFKTPPAKDNYIFLNTLLLVKFVFRYYVCYLISGI
jgi:hypothetical protein